jgi:hypothetical protein
LSFGPARGLPAARCPLQVTNAANAGARSVTSNPHSRYKSALRIGEGIPALFTAKSNSLLFPFLKEFASADVAQSLQQHSANFPRRLPGGPFSDPHYPPSSFANEYYDNVKNLPELRRLFATFF